MHLKLRFRKLRKEKHMKRKEATKRTDKLRRQPLTNKMKNQQRNNRKNRQKERQKKLWKGQLKKQQKTKPPKRTNSYCTHNQFTLFDIKKK